MVVTRFSPTSNGTLHLGHLFTLLVNEQYAHSNDGKFYVRFDDFNPLVLAMPPEKVKNIIHYQQDIIEWLELDVDGWIWESDIHLSVQEKLRELGQKRIPETPLGEEVIPMVMKEEKGWIAIPYVPQQTVERVVMDNMIHTTHVIRGDDFMTEFSLYCYFCQKFDFPTPKFVFLPRLMSSKGDISKTAGGYTITELRNNGYTAQQLKNMMRKACLIAPGNGWQLHNIKSFPQIIL